MRRFQFLCLFRENKFDLILCACNFRDRHFKRKVIFPINIGQSHLLAGHQDIDAVILNGKDLQRLQPGIEGNIRQFMLSFHCQKDFVPFFFDQMHNSRPFLQSCKIAYKRFTMIHLDSRPMSMITQIASFFNENFAIAQEYTER